MHRHRVRSDSVYQCVRSATQLTRTAFTTTSITYQASTYNDAIPASSSLSVSVVITAGKSTLDRTEVLRDVRAYFTIDTFRERHHLDGKHDQYHQYELSVVDIAIAPDHRYADDRHLGRVGVRHRGRYDFRVVITVKNISSATLNTIVANPTPPTPTKTGTFALLASCSSRHQPQPVSTSPPVRRHDEPIPAPR